jgi:Uma2 family endonuclease
VRSHGEEMQATSIAKADLQAKCDLLEQKCVEKEQEIVELRYQNQELVAMVCMTWTVFNHNCSSKRKIAASTLVEHHGAKSR